MQTAYRKDMRYARRAEKHIYACIHTASVADGNGVRNSAHRIVAGIKLFVAAAYMPAYVVKQTAALFTLGNAARSGKKDIRSPARARCLRGINNVCGDNIAGNTVFLARAEVITDVFAGGNSDIAFHKLAIVMIGFGGNDAHYRIILRADKPGTGRADIRLQSDTQPAARKSGDRNRDRRGSFVSSVIAGTGKHRAANGCGDTQNNQGGAK